MRQLLKLLPLVALMMPPHAGAKTKSRTMQYFPDGREIVCVNGENRYTRALYGTYTEWRLETSDRPVFATYKKGAGRNIRLYTVMDGRELQLDRTSYCEARYVGGKRTYLLRDISWGAGAELYIEVITANDNEGAVWKIEARKMPKGIRLMAKLCNIVSNKFSRGGDLGKDDLSQFEAIGTEDGLQREEWDAGGTTYLLLTDNSMIRPTRDASLWQRYEQSRQQLVSQVEITTPDPIFNTVGTVLMHAADGLWDGKTWLHGCVGWHVPLAGWRGSYAGDALGWLDRSRSHFQAYARSQVTDVPATVPHPAQDPDEGMARAEKRWGTQMYSNGYVCRLPERNDQMHHYDMNLNYIDGLLWHFSYDADPAQLRAFWPTLKRHLEWEKRNFDPDGDHLYDAYCCIWASDALYYNSGAVTHSSAYNYRGNRLAARIAELIGEDPVPYREEAEAILRAMNEQLWMTDRGTWCEFRDLMGLKRQHPSAALWTVYTPIDCGACSPEQAWQATKYADRDIPHIPMAIIPNRAQLDLLKNENPCLYSRVDSLTQRIVAENYYTMSTTDWQPYVWSTNNVAHEEVANMALAYFQAGRSDEGFRLLKGDLLDEMFLGASPGNFGQISYYDKVLSEAYRDFGDNIGITARALVNGLFGILPDALNGRCVIKPAFPETWREATIKTPYLTYKYHREGTCDIYEIRQHFPQPLRLLVRANAGGGAFLDVEGDDSEWQTIVVDRTQLPMANVFPELKSARADVVSAEYLARMGLDDVTPADTPDLMLDLSAHYNANVDDIFRNQYLSPRSPYTTLEIPVQGIGQWCHPEWMAEIEDDGLRRAVCGGVFDTCLGLRFRLPAEGHNIVYTSLWDNYPDAVEIPVDADGRGYRHAYLMLAGSTNSMQSRIDNGLVIASYTDGTADTLHLENPINWCPIEQDYILDDAAFWAAAKKPYRFRLDNGLVSRNINDGQPLGLPTTITGSGACADRAVHDGAGVLLNMPLNGQRRLCAIRLQTLSCDVVIGLMAVTLR